MAFHSILHEGAQGGIQTGTSRPPDFFTDLNLDQIIDAVTASKQEYNLKPFFYTPLTDSAAIRYRQETMQDLETGMLIESIERFARKMAEMRRILGLIEKLRYRYHKEGWFWKAVEVYCEAVMGLLHDLDLANLRSRGLLAFRQHLREYAGSDTFRCLVTETEKLVADLSTVRYCVIIKGNLVRVRKYEDEPDYSIDVQATFEKFKQGVVKDYRVNLAVESGMNHVEAQILDLVARLYPDVFASLDDYCARNGRFLDQTIAVFDREIQFYVAYLEYIQDIKGAGLAFCYPQIVTASKEVYDRDGFDLALAHKRTIENLPIVSNDFSLSGKERILVVTGPNQGGKTTFARAFGQVHYLASLGCPVPGREAQLFLFDKLFTHFEREEDIRNLRGKLQDDLVRIHAILDQATPNSIIIMNEIFTSTTLQDAVFLSKKILERIIQLDLLCVCVTFIDELASLSEKTVSVVSMVVPENPALRTYKIVRKPADGLAYALSIAEKHRLTYEQLRRRIQA